MLHGLRVEQENEPYNGGVRTPVHSSTNLQNSSPIFDDFEGGFSFCAEGRGTVAMTKAFTAYVDPGLVPQNGEVGATSRKRTRSQTKKAGIETTGVNREALSNKENHTGPVEVRYPPLASPRCEFAFRPCNLPL